MRLFVSSPSDVMPERKRADVVAARLNGELKGVVAIELMRWETQFYTADRSFQQAIDEAVEGMRGTDLVLCILWKRVGSELDPEKWRRPNGSPYESGTVFEYETALQVSRERDGAPDVYLFLKDAPVTYDATNFEVQRAQHVLLEKVLHGWTETSAGHNAAGFQHFSDPDDFETKLELCLRQWLEQHGIGRKTVWDRRIKGSPFRGLGTFDAEHAPVFFGRETAIDRAIRRLRQADEAKTPFLLLIGASGSGKSSLLRAGLMPRITQPGTIPGVDQWRAALVMPGAEPLLALAEALFAPGALGAELRAGDFESPDALAKAFASGGSVAMAPVRAALARAASQHATALSAELPRSARLLIAVDQVERIFAEATPRLTEGFAELLCALVSEQLVTLIIALRSDAYAHFQRVTGFLTLIEAHGGIHNLLPPNADEQEEIVIKPVTACCPPLSFETDGGGRPLSDALVADAHGGDALPLLEMTLQRLYDAEAQRGDGVLRYADYPGLGAAIAEAANEALATLSPAARAELPALLATLVEDIATNADGTIIPLGTALDRRLFERDRTPRAALIDALIDHRLLIAEETNGRAYVRPVHDALLRAWPEAVRIIAENAALIRVRHTIAPMAADWAAAAPHAKPGFLANSPALLAGAERLLDRFGENLTPEILDFITASLSADAIRRDAEQRRQRRVLVATASALIVVLAFTAFTGWQWSVAQTERHNAEERTAELTRINNEHWRNPEIPEEAVKQARATIASCTEQPRGEYKVVDVKQDDPLAIRKDPGAEKRATGLIPADGAGITVSACSASDLGTNLWCKISWRCQTGWVNAHFLVDAHGRHPQVRWSEK